MEIEKISTQEHLGELYGMEVVIDETLPPGTAFLINEDAVKRSMSKRAFQFEEQLKARIKPCPRWMPRRLYNWLLSKTIIITHYPDKSLSVDYSARFTQCGTILLSDDYRKTMVDHMSCCS